MRNTKEDEPEGDVLTEICVENFPGPETDDDPEEEDEEEEPPETCGTCEEELDDCSCFTCSTCEDTAHQDSTYGCESCAATWCKYHWYATHPGHCGYEHCGSCCDCSDEDDDDESSENYCSAGAHYWVSEDGNSGCMSCSGCQEHCKCVPCGMCDSGQPAMYITIAPDMAGGPNVEGRCCWTCYHNKVCAGCAKLKEFFPNCGCVIATPRGRNRVWRHTSIPETWKQWLPAKFHAEGIRPDDYTGHKLTEVADSWGIDQTLDPSVQMARFYLCEAMLHYILPGTTRKWRNHQLEEMRDEIRRMQDEVAEVCDQSFLAYAKMACWGEVRYHPAVRNNNPTQTDVGKTTNRTAMWYVVRTFEHDQPADSWLEIADLFRDYGTAMQSSGVGGEKWALAAELVHMRLTNRLSVKLFVDRMFNLQHNGGCFLNKINWGVAPHTLALKWADDSWKTSGYELAQVSHNSRSNGLDMVDHVGNMHSRAVPPLRALARIAGPDAEALLSEAVRVGNRERLSWNEKPLSWENPLLAWDPWVLKCPKRTAAKKFFDTGEQPITTETPGVEVNPHLAKLSEAMKGLDAVLSTPLTTYTVYTSTSPLTKADLKKYMVTLEPGEMFTSWGDPPKYITEITPTDYDTFNGFAQSLAAVQAVKYGINEPF